MDRVTKMDVDGRLESLHSGAAKDRQKLHDVCNSLEASAKKHEDHDRSMGEVMNCLEESVQRHRDQDQSIEEISAQMSHLQKQMFQIKPGDRAQLDTLSRKSLPEGEREGVAAVENLRLSVAEERQKLRDTCNCLEEVRELIGQMQEVSSKRNANLEQKIREIADRVGQLQEQLSKVQGEGIAVRAQGGVEGDHGRAGV